MEDRTVKLFLTLLCVMWVVSLAGGFVLEWRAQNLNYPAQVSTDIVSPDNNT